VDAHREALVSAREPKTSRHKQVYGQGNQWFAYLVVGDRLLKRGFFWVEVVEARRAFVQKYSISEV
jgi:hypothetical protein